MYTRKATLKHMCAGTEYIYTHVYYSLFRCWREPNIHVYTRVEHTYRCMRVWRKVYKCKYMYIYRNRYMFKYIHICYEHIGNSIMYEYWHFLTRDSCSLGLDVYTCICISEFIFKFIYIYIHMYLYIYIYIYVDTLYTYVSLYKNMNIVLCVCV